MAEARSIVGARPPASGLGEVLDEHAELRELRAQLTEARDPGLLSGLLQRLRDLLQVHFAREEADPELCRTLGAAAASKGGGECGLFDEHRELLATLDAIIGRSEAGSEGSPEAVEGEVQALLDRLAGHDARETALLGAGRDARGRSRPAGLGSRALEVNLRRTAVDVVIPSEQALLLEITEPHYGVHERTRELLREINHRYVGWAQTLEDLHRRAAGDLAYYLESDRAEEAVAVFFSLYAKLAEQARPPSVREAAIRKWFYYLEKIIAEASDGLPALAPAMKRALSRLGAIFREEPEYAVLASPRLRSLAEKLLASSPRDAGRELAERALELHAFSLRRVYECWIAEPDAAQAWRHCAGVGSDGPLPEAVAAISRARLERYLEGVEAFASGAGPLVERAQELLALPDQARLERGHLEAAECIEEVERDSSAEPWRGRIRRIRWLIRILSSDALAGVHEQALAEIHHAYRDALAGADPASVERLLRETFAGLRRSHLGSSPRALALVGKVGALVVGSGDRRLARVVIDEMLGWELPGPGFSGYTDEWQVRVDPAHIRGIRAFLEVIEADPELARPLIAGLVVRLALGGVFVADTDLFQKDVSRLLNSAIGPVYDLVKQLLRLFPVYFEEVGAEGELRDVSSRIDEVTGRRDPLVHFLRKQCHVESNPRLVGFVDAIGDFWSSGDREPLRSWLPAPLFEGLDAGSEPFRELHRSASRIVGAKGFASLAGLDAPALERRLAEVPDARAVDAERIRLLVRLRQLLARKYELGGEDLCERLRARHDVAAEEVAALQRALDERRDEDALSLLLTLLERLRETIAREERTEGFEDIHRKRHIAAGIPSMYGRYREEKLEALGLSFRGEAVASALLERMVSEDVPSCVTRATLRRAVVRLRLLLRALRLDGCRGRGLERGISMLDEALRSEGVSVDQYVNIFQILSRSVERLIRIRFLDVYSEVLERTAGASSAPEGAPDADCSAADREAILKTGEAFLRDRIAQAFGLAPLDRLVAGLLGALVDARERLEADTLVRLLRFDPDRFLVRIEERESPQDGALALGSKGYGIKRMATEGLPVPPGFILGTELFRVWPAVDACPELRAELWERVRGEVARLERRTGSRFGDPERPLLLSVRSGAAISMPGVLDTFLNVGIDESIAEGLAARSGSAWGAWDAYRRFLQFWGMGHGIDRDRFDALMRRSKSEHGVTKKVEIPAEAMKVLALRYRRFVEEQGVDIPGDPMEQVERCVELVMRSWSSEKARLYRAELQIAEEWGTAVIVQGMVYGNLHDRSGTGVVLTGDSSDPGEVSLTGDFVVQGQGDDVVSGLVETLPICAEQRRVGGAGDGRSLERDFPRIYRALRDHARLLVREQGMFHQELEFTFESDDPDDLYILQARDRVMAALSPVDAFLPGPDLDASRLASGIGAGGGALSGRLAHTAEDVDELRRRFPGDPIIVVRPDTVPDDIPLILRAEGVVTSLGGATSHAALVAQQLERTCVVGCRELQVDEERRCSRLGGRTLHSGDFISISGIDGSVYLGRHPAAPVSRSQLV